MNCSFSGSIKSERYPRSWKFVFSFCCLESQSDVKKIMIFHSNLSSVQVLNVHKFENRCLTGTQMHHSLWPLWMLRAKATSNRQITIPGISFLAFDQMDVHLDKQPWDPVSKCQLIICLQTTKLQYPLYSSTLKRTSHFLTAYLLFVAMDVFLSPCGHLNLKNSTCYEPMTLKFTLIISWSIVNQRLCNRFFSCKAFDFVESLWWVTVCESISPRLISLRTSVNKLSKESPG